MLVIDHVNFAPATNFDFYIADCKFGQGLFANRNISIGEYILTFTGSIVNFDQAVLKEAKYQGDPLQIGENLYVNLQEPGRFVNHSCNPNAGIQNDINLIAIRNINAGEEIYFDYSTTMDEDYWTMECSCGSPNCRGIVKDFKHLPTSVKRKYLEMGIVQNFIAAQNLSLTMTVLSSAST